MSSSEEHDRKQQPPYLDPSLVIDTRLGKIEREQAEEKKHQQEYNRKQLRFNGLLVLFTGLLFLTSIVSDFLTLRYVAIAKQSADASVDNAKAARDAVGIARDTLNAGNESFARTFREMQRQSNASADAVGLARENFRKDQRPYIWYKPNKEELPTFFPRSGQILWNWHFVNYGKSLAYHILVTHWITVGEGTPVPDFSTLKPKELAPMIPSQDFFLTAGSETSVTEADFTRLLRTTDNIRLHAVIDYTDSYGSKYQTTICAMHLANGPVMFCTENGSGPSHYPGSQMK